MLIITQNAYKTKMATYEALFVRVPVQNHQLLLLEIPLHLDCTEQMKHT